MNINDRIMEVESGRRVLLPIGCMSPSGSLGFEQVKTILGSDRHSVLVTGDTGTGKEALADCALHLTKLDKNRSQKINCAGMDRNLIGSELFGHKKGAYTGADSNRAGLLKKCDGGILFLDEIGWLPPDLQARLLRFMEDGKIRPLGEDTVTDHARVRIVAATNKDVSKSETLLHDLRHRFDFELALPSLGERGSDVLWFLCEPGCLGGQDVYTGVTLRTLVGMMCHPWTGNVRELKKYCQRKVLLRPTERLQQGDVRHVLDDVLLWGQRKDTEFWSAFAGHVLRVVERKCKDSDEEAFWKDSWCVALLAAVFSSFTHTMGMDGHLVLGPIVPLRVLRDLVGEESVVRSPFDWVPLAELLKADSIGIDHVLRLQVLGGLGSHFGGSLSVIKDFVESYGRCEVERRTVKVMDVDGCMTRVPFQPSSRFVDHFSLVGPLAGTLFRDPGPSTDVASVDTVLDRLGIKGRDREICLKCHGGASNSQIAKSMRIGTTTVHYQLTEMRQDHVELVPFLSKKRAGAKPKRK